LVTRPEQQAGSLCDAIIKYGGSVIRFPLIEIQPIKMSDEADKILQQLDQIDMLIFISANAVRLGLPVLQQINTKLSNKTITAIGNATTKALEEFHISVDIKPEPPYNSESLLALSGMQQVAGKNILIIKGEGGREYLGDELKNRGAQVRYLDTYQRIMPDNNIEDLVRQWHQGKINIVTTSSVEALNNLSLLLGESNAALLKQTPQVVMSQRMFEHTQEAGIIAPVIVATEASDEGVVEALGKLVNATSGVKYE